jgi:hypothetical protein
MLGCILFSPNSLNFVLLFIYLGNISLCLSTQGSTIGWRDVRDEPFNKNSSVFILVPITLSSPADLQFWYHPSNVSSWIVNLSANQIKNATQE